MYPVLHVEVPMIICLDDPAISSGVIALFVFSVLPPWWPNQESDWTEIWSVIYIYLVVHMHKVSSQ
jgi:hypothetical protein